jgi:hypothetical protein
MPMTSEYVTGTAEDVRLVPVSFPEGSIMSGHPKTTSKVVGQAFLPAFLPDVRLESLTYEVIRWMAA